VAEYYRPPLATIALERARELRSKLTDAERELWLHLRAGQLNGRKFRRQHPIPPYTVDFFCASANLVIEVDGSQHNQQMDAARTCAIEALGLNVLRFWDNEVLTQTEAVLAAIWNAVAESPLTPTPLPSGEGLFER
jgi:very-short-patch-repair endonuclease